jgi:hypothetical protein
MAEQGKTGAADADSGTAAAPRRTRWYRHLRGVVTARAAPAAIYGTIVSASVTAAAGEEESFLAVCVSVLVTVLVYWAAEAYSALLAERMNKPAVQSFARLRSHFTERWPMVQASYVPLVVLIVAGLCGADLSLAVTIALSVTTVVLFWLGWVAGRRSGSTGASLLLSATLAACFGLALVGLKAIVH